MGVAAILPEERAVGLAPQRQLRTAGDEKISLGRDGDVAQGAHDRESLQFLVHEHVPNADQAFVVPVRDQAPAVGQELQVGHDAVILFGIAQVLPRDRVP